MADKVLISFVVDAKGDLKVIENMPDAMDKIDKSARKASSGLGVATKAALAFGSVFAIKKMFDFGSAIVQTGSQFQTLAVQMKTVMGSAEGAERATKWIKDFTATTPYQLAQVSQGFVKLKAFGLDPMGGAMQAVADQTAALGGSAEIMDSIILSLGKAFSKGKIEGEEWNMMAERGVKVGPLLAKAMGTTEAAVLKMRTAGKLGRDAIAMLIEEMGKANAGASAALMDTFAGKWSNLMDQISLGMDELAQGGLLDSVTESVGGLISKLETLRSSGKLKEWGESAGEAVRQLSEKIPRLVDGLISIAGHIAKLIELLPQIVMLLERVAVVWGTMWAIGKIQAATTAIAGLGVTSAATAASMKGFAAFLGGPWGAAIAVATLAVYEFVKTVRELQRADEEAFALARRDQELAKQRADQAKAMRDALKDWEGALKSVGVETERMNTVGMKAQLETMREMHARVEKGIELKRVEKRRYEELLPAYQKYLEITEGVTKATTENTAVTEEQRKATIKAAKDAMEAYKKSHKVKLEEIETGIWLAESEKRLDEENQKAIEKNIGLRQEEIRIMTDANGKILEYYDSLGNRVTEVSGLTSNFIDSMLNMAGIKLDFEAVIPEQAEIERALTPMEVAVRESFASAITDAFYLAATGGDIMDAWAGLMDSLMGIASDNIEGFLTQAFSGGFEDESGNKLSFMDALTGTDSGKAALRGVGTMIGGAILSHAQEKQSVWQGAIGGAIMGAAGGVWGAVAGAVVGAISAAMSDDNTPMSRIYYGPSAGFTVAGKKQDLQDMDIERAQQQLNSSLRRWQMAFRELLQVFGDPELFSLVEGVFSFTTDLSRKGGFEEGSISEWIKWLDEAEIPRQMMQIFGEAINAGLSNLEDAVGKGEYPDKRFRLGLAQSVIDQVFKELEQLPGQDRLQALTTFVAAVMGTARLISEGTYDSIVAAASMDSTQRFMQGLSEVADQIELRLVGLENLSMIDRASEVEAIVLAMEQAGQGFRQFVEQLDNLKLSLGRMIDDLMTSIQMQAVSGRASDIQSEIDQYQALIDKDQAVRQQLAQAWADLENAIDPADRRRIMDEIGRLQSSPDLLARDQINRYTSRIAGLQTQLDDPNNNPLAFIEEQIRLASEQLQGATSQEEIQYWTQKLTEYWGQLAGMVDLNALRDDGSTWEQYILANLADVKQIEEARIAAILEQAEQHWNQLYDQLIRAAESLGLFNDEIEALSTFIADLQSRNWGAVPGKPQYEQQPNIEEPTDTGGAGYSKPPAGGEKGLVGSENQPIFNIVLNLRQSVSGDVSSFVDMGEMVAEIQSMESNISADIDSRLANLVAMLG